MDNRVLPTIDLCFALKCLPTDIVSIVKKYSDYELSTGKPLWNFAIPDSFDGQHLAFENNNFAFFKPKFIVVFINFQFYLQFPIHNDYFDIIDLKLIHNKIFLHLRQSIIVYNLDGCKQGILSFDTLYQNAFCVNSVGNVIVCFSISCEIYSDDLKRRIQYLKVSEAKAGLYGFYVCVNVDREDNIYLYGMHGRNVLVFDRLGNYMKNIYLNSIEYLIPTPCKQFIVQAWKKITIESHESLVISKIICHDSIGLNSCVAVTNSGNVVIGTYCDGLFLHCFH